MTAATAGDPQAAQPRDIGDSLREYGRGVAGGLLFSLPLLYTGEIWERGMSISAERLLMGALATGVLLVGYNRYSGLRRDASWVEVIIDSVEEFGLGLLVAALALWLLGRFAEGARPQAALGMIVLEGLLAAIGVSIGTAQLGGDAEDSGSPESDERLGPMGLITLSSCGAVVIAANIAPTEEIAQIADSLSAAKLFGLLIFSLAVAAIICFYSDFIGPRQVEPPSVARSLLETALTYSVALAISAALLWFFGSFSGQGPLTCLARTIVLSTGASLGAAAGRQLLQQS
jgi:putative integral membrane protein (TIGR02587 family)